MDNETNVIYIHPQKRIISQKKKYFYLTFTGLFFLSIGLISADPIKNIKGLYTIITSPSNLLTDYLALGGFGKRIYKCWYVNFAFNSISVSA